MWAMIVAANPDEDPQSWASIFQLPVEGLRCMKRPRHVGVGRELRFRIPTFGKHPASHAWAHDYVQRKTDSLISESVVSCLGISISVSLGASGKAGSRGGSCSGTHRANGRQRRHVVYSYEDDLDAWTAGGMHVDIYACIYIYVHTYIFD